MTSGSRLSGLPARFHSRSPSAQNDIAESTIAWKQSSGVHSNLSIMTLPAPLRTSRRSILV